MKYAVMAVSFLPSSMLAAGAVLSMWGPVDDKGVWAFWLVVGALLLFPSIKNG